MKTGLKFDKFVLFGDSITEYAYDQSNGFALGPALQSVYARKLDIVQRGFRGYNSDHAVEMVGDIIANENAGAGKVKLMYVFFGSNDASALPSPQHVPKERYQANLRKIVAAIRAADIKPIIVGPGAFNIHQWKVGRPWAVEQRTQALAREYSYAARDVAAELSVPFIGLWDLLMASVGWREGEPIMGDIAVAEDAPLAAVLTDGLHYNGAAYKVFYDAVLATIKESYPELHYDNLETHLPHFDQLTTIDVLKQAL
ncbi:SGNH hydrolase-type esterase domain-containing protein [Dipodascopsis tothii]|uniref:SGNH hydrolase-type esterase domain-containing protein n=1 Tax=Dipodascopsis tothii TaxID=44089 RepID=UPI0034CE34CD